MGMDFFHLFVVWCGGELVWVWEVFLFFLCVRVCVLWDVGSIG